MKISTVNRKDELNALFIEHEDLNNWDTVVCKMRGHRFDHVFILPLLSIEEHTDLLNHKTEDGQVYGCWNLHV